MINQQRHLQRQEEAYSNFINSINSEETRREYHTNFSYFMKFCQKTTHQDMLLVPVAELESTIRDYIVHLRHHRRLSPSTVSSYMSPIIHFYEMNGVIINWRRLKKFRAKYYSVIEDRPYNRDQIKTLVDATSLRDKCIILVMCSAGLRRGAVPHLRIRDLEKIDKYGLYRINVYKKEQEQYTTFCTPECANYIEQYLDRRKRLGEQLKPNSPLFRLYISGPAFYSLEGYHFAKPKRGMTDNHTVVSQLSSVSFIDNLPSQRHSVHDIRLRFKTEGIWSTIRCTHPEIIPNEVSKDLSLLPIWMHNM